MKAVVLCPELFAAEGGIARTLRLYVRAWAEEPNHHELAVICLNDREFPAHRGRPLPSGAAPVSWRACGRRRQAFLRHAWCEARGATRMLCGHIGQLPAARMAALRNPRLSLYLVAHGIEVWRPFSPLERWALRGVRRVWCVSHYTRERMSAHLPSRELSRLHVLPNAVDPLFSAEAGATAPRENAPPTILCVARLDRDDAYKGVDRLIDAFATLLGRAPEARLRIAGDGTDRARLEQRAADAGCREQVTFLGAIDDFTLRGEFAGCHVFALPSEREGFGLVYVEAAAQGKPSVALRAGAVPEVVAADTGVLAPAGDPAALVAALEQALHRTWDAQRIREHASLFSYEAFSRRLKGAY